MNACKERAYAKINLFLDCVGRREDGFHEIKTVMHSLTLHDTLTVAVASRATRAVRLSVLGNRHIPTDSRNLAYSAAMLFLERARIDAEVHIKLEKRIPVAAGLAGGSTDAAATLRALNRLFGKPFADKALMQMAAELGSDVPYCLLGGTALCEGRGEVITRLPEKIRLFAVVAIGSDRVSTPAAYSRLDEKYGNFDGSTETGGNAYIEKLLQYANGGEFPPIGLFNVFEESISEICPSVAEIKKALLECGAKFAMMSGSGPSVFGIFESEAAAKLAKDALTNKGINAYYAESV